MTNRNERNIHAGEQKRDLTPGERVLQDFLYSPNIYPLLLNPHDPRNLRARAQARIQRLGPEDSTFLAGAIMRGIPGDRDVQRRAVAVYLFSEIDLLSIENTALIKQFNTTAAELAHSDRSDVLADWYQVGNILVDSLKRPPKADIEGTRRWESMQAARSLMFTRLQSIRTAEKGPDTKRVFGQGQPHVVFSDTIVEKFLYERSAEFQRREPGIWTGVRAEAYLAISMLTPEESTYLAQELMHECMLPRRGRAWRQDIAFTLAGMINPQKVDTSWPGLEIFRASFPIPETQPLQKRPSYKEIEGIEEKTLALGGVITQSGNDERKALSAIEREIAPRDRALLGHLLQFSYDHAEVLGLSQIFGITLTKGGHGQRDEALKSDRIRLLFELGEGNHPLTRAAVTQSLKEAFPGRYVHSTIRKYLLNFVSAGLLSYQSIPQGREYVYYTHIYHGTDAKPAKATNIPTQTADIFDVMRLHPERILSTEGWHALYCEMMADEGKRAGHINNTSRALIHLVREGHAAKEGKFDREQRSDITFTPRQKSNLDALTSILYRYLVEDPDFIESGLQLADTFARNKALSEELRTKAAKVDPKRAQPRREDTVNHIRDLLSVHRFRTIEQIQAYLADQGIVVKAKSIQDYIRNIPGVDSERRGRHAHYFRTDLDEN